MTANFHPMIITIVIIGIMTPPALLQIGGFFWDSCWTFLSSLRTEWQISVSSETRLTISSHPGNLQQQDLAKSPAPCALEMTLPPVPSLTHCHPRFLPSLTALPAPMISAVKPQNSRSKSGRGEGAAIQRSCNELVLNRALIAHLN